MQKFYLRLATVLGLMAFQSYCEIRAQTLDPSFAAIDLRQPAIITDALQQPDGKIVAVGTFTQVNGSPATGLARLNADGTLDQAFTTAAASQSFPRKVRCFANGQLLVTGYTLKVGGQSFLTVAKLNADGTVASDFVRSTSELSPSDVIIQPDNKILLCGTFRGPNGLAITGLIRLNADGTVDQAFSAALGAGFLLNGSPVPYLCMALQADGKIIVGGYFQSYQGTARSSLVRLNPDGSLDTTYTPTFKTSRTFPNPSIYAVAIDPRTGYAVVYGEFFGQSQSIVRLDLAGQQDVTFQDVGRPDCHTGNSSLAVDAAGRVLFSSCFNNFNSSVLMRLRADGTEDTQFAVLKQLDERVYVARPLADGTVLIGGGFGRYGTTRNVNLLRLSATGQVVPGFTPALTAPGAIFTLAVQPDGKVVVGGRFSQLNGAPANNLARLTAAGTLDPTFNLTGTDGAVRKVLVQASGRILVAGAFQVAGTHTSPFVARLLAGGTADNAFTSTGSIVNYLSFAGIYGMGVNAISEQPDGSIIAAGSFISFNGFLGTVHRLLTNGSADAAYAGNIGSGTSTSDVYSVASLPDGRHYVGGDFPVFKEVFVENLVRLQANGTRDTGFELATPQPPRYIASLLPLPNGELLIGGQGYKEGNPTVIRVTDLGAVTATPAVGGSVAAMARYANGRVLLAGGEIEVGATPPASLVRLNPNATYDASFAPAFTSSTDRVRLSDVALQADEAILVAGNFTQVGSTPRSFLVRLAASNVLGVSNRQGGPATEAWPMPAHDQLHLKLDAAARPQSVTLTDVTGRVVLHQLISAQTAPTLNTSALAVGTYLLRVNYASGPVTRRIAVK